MKSLICKIFIIGSLMLISCTNKDEDALIKYSSFDEVISLTARKIEVPSVLLYPRGIYLSNDNLVVLNEKMDTLFQVFEFPEMKYKGQFGIKGGGPNDFVLPLIQPVAYDDNKFVLSDGNKLKKVSFDADGFHVGTTTLPFEFPYYNGLQRLTDSLYCCFAGFEDEQPLILLTPDGGSEKIGNYPEDVSPRFKNTLARNQAYTGFLISNPNGTRMAMFYQYLRRWRIFDANGDMLSDNCMEMQPGSSLPKVEDEERYIHPIAVYATDNFIYTLNLDMTALEVGNQARNPNIQVFSWDGKPLKQYKLDCFISSFVVNEKTGEIFGVFVEDMNHIYQFKLE